MVEKILSEGFQSRNDLNYFLTDLKESTPWLYDYHSKMLQMTSTQIDGAQKSLIQLRKNGHKTGQLRFAKFSEYNTIQYNQSGFKISVGFLNLSKIGTMRLIQHRSIPENSEIKQVIISKSKSGKWYACIVVGLAILIPKITLNNSVGIDIGIKNFAYDSNGHVTPNPLNLKKMLKPIRRIQRKISRRHRGSQNYKKAVKFYQIIHERIKNKRKDFLHKLTTMYANKHHIVFIEKLQKLNMMKNHRLARSISDSGWGIFSNMLEYKTMVVEVPARNTTIDCSRCGSSMPKSMAVRIHKCTVCGLVLDRDYNASINILKKGLEIFNMKLPQELREVTPVEILLRSMKQETTVSL